MMQYKWIIALCASFFTLNTYAVVIDATGPVVSQSRPVTSFSKLEVKGDFNLHVYVDGRHAVDVVAEKSLQPFVQTHVHKGKLTIGDQPDLLATHQPIFVNVHAARLEEVKVYGASRVRITGIVGHEFEYKVRGKTDATLAGVVDKLELDVRGDNNINAKHLRSHQAQIESMGHLHAIVRVADRLKLKVFGRSEIEYLGNPDIERHVFGNATVKALPAKK